VFDGIVSPFFGEKEMISDQDSNSDASNPYSDYTDYASSGWKCSCGRTGMYLFCMSGKITEKQEKVSRFSRAQLRIKGGTL
jgi:hypothetical protein